MQPAQAAALLGREIDTGFAAAFSDLASSRALVVDRIVARVGALPSTSGDEQGTSPDWTLVPWAAEVVLVPGTPVVDAVDAVGGDGDGDDPWSPGPEPEGSERIRRTIAALSTRKIRGVGDGWAATFARWDLPTIGDLAAEDPGVIVRRAQNLAAVVLPLLARARDLTEPWPRVPAALTGRTITQVAYSTPSLDDLAQHQLRAHCLRILGALDAAQAARLVL